MKTEDSETYDIKYEGLVNQCLKLKDQIANDCNYLFLCCKHLGFMMFMTHEHNFEISAFSDGFYKKYNVEIVVFIKVSVSYKETMPPDLLVALEKGKIQSKHVKSHVYITNQAFVYDMEKRKLSYKSEFSQ